MITSVDRNQMSKVSEPREGCERVKTLKHWKHQAILTFRLCPEKKKNTDGNTERS